MAAGGPVDPTMPLPADGERRGAPQPPEAPEPIGAGALPGAYDPTIAVPPVGDEPGGPGGGGPGGPEVPGEDEGDDRKKWIYGILAVLGVIILGVVVALLLSGGDDDGDGPAATTTSAAAVTSTSTSSSTSTTSTTATTVPNAPSITAFSAAPNPAVCPNAQTTVQITLTWSTLNALGVSVSIDGPGKYADYGANGSAQVPFPCSGPHTYTLTANGANNQTAQRTITVQPQIVAPTTTTTSAPPTTTTTKA